MSMNKALDTIDRLLKEKAQEYSRGRKEAIAEAATWLMGRADVIESEIDDEDCEGSDADRCCADAAALREASTHMQAQLQTEGPDRTSLERAKAGQRHG